MLVAGVQDRAAYPLEVDSRAMSVLASELSLCSNLSRCYPCDATYLRSEFIVGGECAGEGVRTRCRSRREASKLPRKQRCRPQQSELRVRRRLLLKTGEVGKIDPQPQFRLHKKRRAKARWKKAHFCECLESNILKMAPCRCLKLDREGAVPMACCHSSRAIGL